MPLAPMPNAGPCKIIDDARPIASVTWDDADGSYHAVGSTCDSIVPYAEAGLGSDVTWLAIMRGTEVMLRVPSWQVTISYASDPARLDS